MLPCHRPEQTRAYERGHPHHVELVDGHKDDKKPDVSATKVFREYFGVYHVRWPRLTAAAFARASAAYEDDWESDDVKRAASATGPMTRDEAATLVRAWLAKVDRGDFYETSALLFVLEALTSTDDVLEALVRELEALPESRWNAAEAADGNPAFAAFASGFLLLRSAERAAFAKRLEALYEATVKAGVVASEHNLRGALDLALHGNEGAKRTLAQSHWQYWYWYLHVDDPAIHLARLANNAKSEWVPEPRLLWLAGDAPRDYLRENAAYARPKLERMANGSGASAVKAKAALALL